MTASKIRAPFLLKDGFLVKSVARISKDKSFRLLPHFSNCIRAHTFKRLQKHAKNLKKSNSNSNKTWKP